MQPRSWFTFWCSRPLALRVACLGLLCPALAPAQVVWDNSNGTFRWNTAQNWSTNVLPTGTDVVQFNASPNITSSIQLRAAAFASSLNFNSVNDNFSIINGTGSQTLTLTTGDITRTAGSSNTQSLAFTTLALGGDAAMNIAGSGSLTISAAIVDSGGARSLTKTGAGELILSGANTYSNSTIVSAGTLTLASSSALGTGGSLTLSGGTLKLSTASTTVTNLNVTSSSTIDFGGAVATLNVTNLTVSAGVTLNIINWVNASDFFFATNWTGAAFDTTGANPMNQVVFNSPTFVGNNTKWLGYGSHEVTPLPEPSAYGTLLLFAATGLIIRHRRRVTPPPA